MIKNLSAALSVVARAQAWEYIGHADISAWGAPSECHRDFERGEERRWRLARKKVHGLTQLSWQAFTRRLRREHGLELHHCDRVWGKVLNRTMENSGHPLFERRH